MLGLCNPIYALKSAAVAGLGPGSSAHGFLPFLDLIHSPKYTRSSTAFADLCLVLCSYVVKRFVFYASVILYLFVAIVSLCDNLCVLFLNESYCCAQEFFFVNCVTSNNNMLQNVVKFLSLLLLTYHEYFLRLSLPFTILLECKLESLVVNFRN